MFLKEDTTNNTSDTPKERFGIVVGSSPMPYFLFIPLLSSYLHVAIYTHVRIYKCKYCKYILYNIYTYFIYIPFY